MPGMEREILRVQNFRTPNLMQIFNVTQDLI